MAEKPKDTDTASLTGKITNQPTFDSVNIGLEERKHSIEVKNSMPPIPNKNRDDSGNNQNES